MKELRTSVGGSIENFDAYILNKREEKIPILLSVAFLYDKSLDLKKELKKRKKFPTVGYFRDKRTEEVVDNIAKEITSTTNERELFDKILEKIAKMLKAEACSLLAYNEILGVLQVITSYGMPEVLKKTESLESYEEKGNLIGMIFSSKKTLNIRNIDIRKQQPKNIEIKLKNAQNFAKHSKFKDFKHFLGVPLIVQGEVYGVIRVLNKYSSDSELDNQGFTYNDQLLLERISNQVSILVEKVRGKGQFRAISEVGKKLNEMYDVPLSNLLETIAREVVKGMRFKACYLRLIEEGDILKIKAYYGLKGNYTNNEKYNLKIGQGISGEVVQNGEYRVIEDLQKEKKFEFKEILKPEELRSMLSVPLKYRNRVIGVINCYTRRIHKFTEQEVQIVRTFAAYASTAIQNKKRLEELVYALNEIGSELVKPINIEELFDLILEKAKILSGADSLCIKAYDERTSKIKIVNSLDCKWHKRNKDVEINIWGEIVDVIKNGKSQIIPYSEEMRQRCMLLPDIEILEDIKSSALIPIKIDKKVFGIIFLDSYKDNFFTEDDLLVLEAFSNQAAIAIRNANLFDKLQRVTETFPGISELDTDMDRVLQNIANIAGVVLETDILLLYRWDEEKGKIIWPPIYAGNIRSLEYMMSEVISSATPMHLIEKGESHYAENSIEDPIMTSEGEPPRGNAPVRFVFREGIVSSAGILLKVGQEKVGVMFINYRTPHKFDEDERRIIENYASYIAIAIQNVKHFSEKQAAAAMQTLGQLAAAIAHKIKNDIGTINLYAGDLIDETPPGTPHYSSLAQIKDKVRKISTDINNLLVASRKKTPERKSTDIKNLINEIEKDIESDLKSNNIELKQKIAADIPKIKIDPAQIKMVLSNLAYNSIEAMPKGGKISISISESEESVLVHWEDTGKGIPSKNYGRVFQPFWTTKNKGFGLGLFLSKTIIEQHGGSISLDLNYIGGAKFVVEIPIKDQD
jgi:GAF domain-containing protein